MKNALAPIIVFAYNRPNHLRQTLQALANNELAKESIIYIHCDGPKETANDEQRAHIAETKQVAHDDVWISSFKEVHVIDQEKNKGLRTSIISGATEVIKRYSKVIVVEDDLETSPYFLKYMNEALNKYESYRGVFSISAQSYVNPIEFPKDYQYDVYAFPTHEPTGWATWVDRWNLVDWDIDKKMSQPLASQPYLRQAFMRAGEGMYYSSLLERLNGLDVWSICFSLAHFKHHAVSILPVISYIHNIGFDGSGVNSGLRENSYLNHDYFLKAKNDVRFLEYIYEDARIANLSYSYTVMRRRPFFKRVLNALIRKITGRDNFILKGKVFNDKMNF